MATKRSFADVHPSRRDQVPESSRKRQKPDNLGSKSFKKAHPVNELKTRARNVARLLARTDDKLPANIRIEKERELQTVQYELREAQAAERKSKMIARYHHIRFFERQKATRGLKRAKKQWKALNSAPDKQEQGQLEQEIEDYELDINYTSYYPLDRPYHSLYPKAGTGIGPDDDHDAVHLHRGDPEMRRLVKQCMQNGKLQALRDGLLTSGAEDAVPAQAVQKRTAKERKPDKAHSKDPSLPGSIADVEDDSDGGFFE